MFSQQIFKSYEYCKKIILVGCGEMGSTHLKSLLFFNKNYKIIVVEKNKSRLKKK